MESDFAFQGVSDMLRVKKEETLWIFQGREKNALPTF